MQKIEDLHQKSNAATKKAERLFAQFTRARDDIESDGSLNRGQRAFLLKAEREKILPEIVELTKTARSAAEQAATQRKFWESNAFLLNHAVFNESPSSDGSIKTWHSSRLANMPMGLLELEFAHARQNGEFALMGLILNARAASTAKSKEGDFSLDRVELPNQKACLAAINTCEGNRIIAENIFTKTAGLRNEPAKNLTAARAIVARDAA